MTCFCLNKNVTVKLESGKIKEQTFLWWALTDLSVSDFPISLIPIWLKDFSIHLWIDFTSSQFPLRWNKRRKPQVLAGCVGEKRGSSRRSKRDCDSSRNTPQDLVDTLCAWLPWSSLSNRGRLLDLLTLCFLKCTWIHTCISGGRKSVRWFWLKINRGGHMIILTELVSRRAAWIMFVFSQRQWGSI